MTAKCKCPLTTCFAWVKALVYIYVKVVADGFFRHKQTGNILPARFNWCKICYLCLFKNKSMLYFPVVLEYLTCSILSKKNGPSILSLYGMKHFLLGTTLSVLLCMDVRTICIAGRIRASGGDRRREPPPPGGRRVLNNQVTSTRIIVLLYIINSKLSRLTINCIECLVFHSQWVVIDLIVYITGTVARNG